MGAETNWWIVLRFSIELAHKEKIDDGTALRKAVLDASGIEELKNVLQERFFSRGDLIQPLTLLKKLVEPSRSAPLELKNKLGRSGKDLEESRRILYEPPYNTEPQFDIVRKYFDDMEASVNASKKRIEHLADKIGRIGETAEYNWTDFDTDFSCLNTLESAAGVSQEDVEMLQRLFGKYGTTVEQRLGLESKLGSVKSVKKAIELAKQKHEHCLPSVNSQPYKHAVKRLEQMLTFLEELKEKEKLNA